MRWRKMQKADNSPGDFNAPFSASVFYCPACDVPVVTPTSQIDDVTGKGDCPLCGGTTKYLATDLRPVFPEERLLLELLLEAEPFSLAEKSVWAQDSRYYIAGKARSIPAKLFSGADTDILSVRLEQLKKSERKRRNHGAVRESGSEIRAGEQAAPQRACG